MLAQGRLRDAEHARNVRFGDAVGGHRLGLPPLRVSRGPDRSSHWEKSTTIIALCGNSLACPLRGDGVEASTVTVEHRVLAGELLPALHRNIDISRRDLNRAADAAGHLSRDYGCAAATERLVDRLPRRRIILDRPAHALD